MPRAGDLVRDALLRPSPAARGRPRSPGSTRRDLRRTTRTTRRASCDAAAARPADRPPGPALGRGKHAVLVVLQGIDAAGKDGTIKHVMAAFNPQGCAGHVVQGPDAGGARPRLPVAGPPATSRARARSRIFNRSHYEDVLVVRVHDLVPRSVWSKRYDQINDVRADARRRTARRSSSSSCRSTGTSSASASRRATTTRPSAGSSRLGDLEERKRWDDYQAAFEEALDARRRPTYAPWYVIPANRKWFREPRRRRDPGRHARRPGPAYPPAAEDLPADLVIEVGRRGVRLDRLRAQRLPARRRTASRRRRGSCPGRPAT